MPSGSHLKGGELGEIRDRTLTLTVGPVAHGGHCVARHEGRVIFVRHALPGEVVQVRLTEYDDGASFWRADVTEVIQPSTDRVKHFWAAADAPTAYAAGQLPVGGAEFGHITRAGQRRLKEAVLAEQLHRLAEAGYLPGTGTGTGTGTGLGTGLPEVEDVDAAGTPDQAAGLAWRTRAGFAVTAAGRLGMHAHRSNQVLPIEAMPLAAPAINALRLWETDLTGIARIEVAAPSTGSAPLVLLAPEPALSAKAAGKVLKRVATQLGQGTAGLASAGRAAVSVAGWDPESGLITPLRGRSWVSETSAGHEFRVSGAGFWQIHRLAPAVLTDAVLDFLQDGNHLAAGSVVADLYAGAGLFTAPLADVVGPEGSVLSVEGSAGASRDARKNLHAAAQVTIQGGRVERVLAGARHRFDAVVLDPPRAGAGKPVIQRLVASSPRAIAYVSCDPASFARDLGYFRTAGWKLERLRAFDLYPNTHHLETVALLTPGTHS
ncbi:class I SAM-dependent RNA methyltransferase [Paenarthrobacter sp. Z7-10]|nr:class I SAM-dependent RNA methyltransferase [Paenarthrobacter sp. Z7-10]